MKKQNSFLLLAVLTGGISIFLCNCVQPSANNPLPAEENHSENPAAENPPEQSTEEPLDLPESNPSSSSSTPESSSSAEPQYDDRILHGTTWKNSSTLWDNYNANNKTYYEYNNTMQFSSDGSGILTECIATETHVYNLVTRQWQITNRSTCPKYYFEFEMTSATTANLNNMRLEKDQSPTGITWNISELTRGSFYFDNRKQKYTKNY